MVSSKMTLKFAIIALKNSKLDISEYSRNAIPSGPH